MAISNEQVVDFLKKNPISVSCAVLSIFMAGWGYYRSDKAAEYSAELEEKSTEAQRLALNRKNAEQLNEHYESIVAAEKQIEARLIHPRDLTANSQYFYQLESDTGVKLLDQRTIGNAPKKDAKLAYVPVPFVVSVQGDYTQVMTFLQHLENGRHFCRVLTATCSPNGNDRSAPLTLSLSIDLLGIPQ